MISAERCLFSATILFVPETYGELAYVDSGRRPEYVRLIR